MRPVRFIAFLAAATIVFAGCGGGAAAPTPTATSTTAVLAPTPTATSTTAAVATAKAEGAATVNLGDGKITALPKGTLYVQYLEIPQPVGGVLAHAHIAGFVYGIEGTTKLAVVGGETKDLKPTEAAFVPADAGHTHSNPGTTPNLWYFISIRPNTARTAAPTFPGQKELFATADLPALVDGAYTLGLRAVTVQPNGRTAAHKHGGRETIVVLDGSVELRVQGAALRTLKKGEGVSIEADTPLQVWNKGTTPAKFLAFFVTADGIAFSTDVDASP